MLIGEAATPRRVEAEEEGRVQQRAGAEAPRDGEAGDVEVTEIPPPCRGGKTRRREGKTRRRDEISPGSAARTTGGGGGVWIGGAARFGAADGRSWRNARALDWWSSDSGSSDGGGDAGDAETRMGEADVGGSGSVEGLEGSVVVVGSWAGAVHGARERRRSGCAGGGRRG
jgi:hypothetical protein